MKRKGDDIDSFKLKKRKIDSEPVEIPETVGDLINKKLLANTINGIITDNEKQVKIKEIQDKFGQINNIRVYSIQNIKPSLKFCQPNSQNKCTNLRCVASTLYGRSLPSFEDSQCFLCIIKMYCKLILNKGLNGIVNKFYVKTDEVGELSSKICIGDNIISSGFYGVIPFYNPSYFVLSEDAKRILFKEYCFYYYVKYPIALNSSYYYDFIVHAKHENVGNTELEYKYEKDHEVKKAILDNIHLGVNDKCVIEERSIIFEPKMSYFAKKKLNLFKQRCKNYKDYRLGNNKLKIIRDTFNRNFSKVEVFSDYSITKAVTYQFMEAWQRRDRFGVLAYLPMFSHILSNQEIYNNADLIKNTKFLACFPVFSHSINDYFPNIDVVEFIKYFDLNNSTDMSYMFKISIVNFSNDKFDKAIILKKFYENKRVRDFLAKLAFVDYLNLYQKDITAWNTLKEIVKFQQDILENGIDDYIFKNVLSSRKKLCTKMKTYIDYYVKRNNLSYILNLKAMFKRENMILVNKVRIKSESLISFMFIIHILFQIPSYTNYYQRIIDTLTKIPFSEYEKVSMYLNKNGKIFLDSNIFKTKEHVTIQLIDIDFSKYDEYTIFIIFIICDLYIRKYYFRSQSLSIRKTINQMISVKPRADLYHTVYCCNNPRVLNLSVLEDHGKQKQQIEGLYKFSFVPMINLSSKQSTLSSPCMVLCTKLNKDVSVIEQKKATIDSFNNIINVYMNNLFIGRRDLYEKLVQKIFGNVKSNIVWRKNVDGAYKKMKFMKRGRPVVGMKRTTDPFMEININKDSKYNLIKKLCKIINSKWISIISKQDYLIFSRIREELFYKKRQVKRVNLIGKYYIKGYGKSVNIIKLCQQCGLPRLFINQFIDVCKFCIHKTKKKYQLYCNERCRFEMILYKE